MGSQIGVWLAHEDAFFAADCLRRVHVLFDEYEACMTRFDPASELSQLNEAEGWTAVSDLLWDVITVAVDLSAATHTLFTPTLLNAIEAAGYTHTFDPAQPFHPRTHTPIINTKIALDPAQKAICLPAGMRLDLGGIGKGYTAEQAVSMLNLLGASACLIDAGGDLRAGGAPPTSPGWAVGIARPSANREAADDELTRLWLADGAMATSGVDYRRWEIDGVLAHHIIDPRTAAPAATDLLTVTVLADDLCTAEAWSTAALVAGSQAGYAMLCAADLAAVLITQQNEIIPTPAAIARLPHLSSI